MCAVQCSQWRTPAVACLFPMRTWGFPQVVLFYSSLACKTFIHYFIIKTYFLSMRVLDKEAWSLLWFWVMEMIHLLRKRWSDGTRTDPRCHLYSLWPGAVAWGGVQGLGPSVLNTVLHAAISGCWASWAKGTSGLAISWFFFPQFFWALFELN